MRRKSVTVKELGVEKLGWGGVIGFGGVGCLGIIFFILTTKGTMISRLWIIFDVATLSEGGPTASPLYFPPMLPQTFF